MNPASNRIFKPGNQFLMAYLTFLSAFPPLTTDMYLPALPNFAESLHTSNELASYSLTIFFLVYAAATLFWGPVSDKYGRKPVLFWGSILYIIASLAIIFVGNIWELLILRGMQAIGCASASAISLAIVKDVLRGKKMDKIVSLMQAAHILAPLSAPVLGGLLLYFMNWRGIFGVLTFCGVLALSGSLCLSETRKGQHTQTIGQTFARMKIVLENRIFTVRLILFSLLTMPFFSFLAASAFLYQIQFHLTAQAFSAFFAFNAAFSLLGPLSHLYIFSHKNRNTVIFLEILCIPLGGILILFFGSFSPYLFALLMAPVTFLGSALRPPSTVLLMESIKGDNGIVASLIQCGAMLCGSLAMYLATLPFWSSAVLAIGAITVIAGFLSLFLWRKVQP